MFEPQPERIVCAAIRKGEMIICGVRHFDKLMQQQMPLVRLVLFLQNYRLYWLVGWYYRRTNKVKWECGFITNKMRFVDRDEAWGIAQSQKQLCWGEDRKPGKLFSEDLY